MNLPGKWGSDYAFPCPREKLPGGVTKNYGPGRDKQEAPRTRDGRNSVSTVRKGVEKGHLYYMTKCVQLASSKI